MGYKIRKIMNRSDGIYVNVLFDNGDVHTHIFPAQVERSEVEIFFDDLDEQKTAPPPENLKDLVGFQKDFDDKMNLLGVKNDNPK